MAQGDYWAENFWATNYWNDDYWGEYVEGGFDIPRSRYKKQLPVFIELVALVTRGQIWPYLN